MENIQTLQAQLEQARAAYHQLQIGQLRVRIGMGDMQIEYTAANVQALRTYILELENRLRIAQGCAPRRVFTTVLPR